MVILIVVCVLLYILISVFIGTLIANYSEFGIITDNDVPFCIFAVMVWPFTIVACGLLWSCMLTKRAAERIYKKYENQH